MLKAFVTLTALLVMLYLISPLGREESIFRLSDKDKILLAQEISRGGIILSTLERQPSDRLELISFVCGVKQDTQTGFPELALVYEAEDLSSLAQTVVDDAEAHNHKARRALTDENSPFSLVYGPYDTLPAGKYRACFRLKSADCSTSETVAKIDVASQIGEDILSQKNIRGNEFSYAGQYQTFCLKFTLEKRTSHLEYRVFFTDKADLWVDNITIEPDFSALF
ncbi:MAG: hypothetical protein U9Q24_03175 [Candidatus Ratteibacteria bacterium]|nr:hypothetical protein [Candidatus Ratteibacteria bacterium]